MRVARKNLREIAGKSLLQWTIEAALGARCLDRVVVSTEDAQVAALARACGADVPFERPAHLAQDPYGVVDVCLHALDQLEAVGERFEHIVVLLPTSPFRKTHHIRDAIGLYFETGTGFLMSVSPLDPSLLAAHVLRGQMMEPLHPEWIGRLGARARKEELPRLAKANGAVTVLDVERFRAERKYYVYPLAAYSMPWPEGLDVDTEEDFMLAEALLATGRASIGG